MPPRKSAKPEGFIVIPNFVDAQEERAILEELASAPQLDKSHLRFSNSQQQEYGPAISDMMEVIVGAPRSPLPPACKALAARVSAEAAKLSLEDAERLADPTCNFLRVNHYCEEGGGYMHKHMDSKKCFGPVIACCSLLADASMTFYDTKGNSFGLAPIYDTAEVPVPRRSLYFMSGPARSQWQHGIRKDQCPRERLSLTFRTVREDAPLTSKTPVRKMLKRPAASTAPVPKMLKRPAAAGKRSAGATRARVG
mmetsp:Transcript_59237/g.128128  ORF Transcript_59237/g.128128 Transcript_59237/m.128128 type:complete len:253 (+) Transcript_59237:78-836(+)